MLKKVELFHTLCRGNVVRNNMHQVIVQPRVLAITDDKKIDRRNYTGGIMCKDVLFLWHGRPYS